MGLSINVDAGEVRREIAFLIRRLKNPSPVLKRIGTFIRGLISEGFRQSRDPGTGELWKRLAESTIKARRRGGRRGFSARGRSTTRAQILVDTSDLKNSIRARVQGRSSVFVGTNKKYGIFHQKGRGVPRRRFLPEQLQDNDMDEILAIVRRYVEGKRR